MAWYDWFASIYDGALERSYREQRVLAADALALRPGMSVLDAPCGTGASFPLLAPSVGTQGRVIGVDLSEGMLRRARARTERERWPQVELHRHDLQRLTASDLHGDAPRLTPVDRVHVFLGMSAMPDMTQAFTALWALLAPGGRCVIVDVHAERLGLQGWMVNRIARADIRRRFWEPLAAVARDFELRDLPFRREHGGQIMLAVGDKPG
jgi:ubiquinone/menaquinone biosynthesis C-methylase UbiE